MSLRTPDVVPAILAFVEIELTRNAVVWQLILAAGGPQAGFQPAFSPPGGLKGRLQARLPARSAHIAAWLTSISSA
jgi:hypothetical protein